MDQYRGTSASFQRVNTENNSTAPHRRTAAAVRPGLRQAAALAQSSSGREMDTADDDEVGTGRAGGAPPRRTAHGRRRGRGGQEHRRTDVRRPGPWRPDRDPRVRQLPAPLPGSALGPQSRDRAPRSGRNPATGGTVELGGGYMPRFKPGKRLRERVNEAWRRETDSGIQMTMPRKSSVTTGGSRRASRA